MLKWIFERCNGTADAVDTPIGKVPADGALDTKGLDVDDDDMKELLRVDTEGLEGRDSLDQGALPVVRRQAAVRLEGRTRRAREAAGLAPLQASRNRLMAGLTSGHEPF